MFRSIFKTFRKNSTFRERGLGGSRDYCTVEPEKQVIEVLESDRRFGDVVGGMDYRVNMGV